MNNDVSLTRIEAGSCSHDVLQYNTKYVASKSSGNRVHNSSKPNVSDNQNRYIRERERHPHREREQREIDIERERERERERGGEG